MGDRLWAGWRMAYIREAAGTGASPEANAQECLFCRLATAGPGPGTLVLEAYEHCFTVLNAFPYVSGHLLVAPYRHTDSLAAPDAAASAEILAAVERARRLLAAEYRPDGFNVGVNLGRAAGAGVVGHVHWHVVPRWQGDTNFMPALAETRVMPESLPDSYARLVRACAAVAPEGLRVKERGA